MLRRWHNTSSCQLRLGLWSNVESESAAFESEFLRQNGAVQVMLKLLGRWRSRLSYYLFAFYWSSASKVLSVDSKLTVQTRAQIPIARRTKIGPSSDMRYRSCDRFWGWTQSDVARNHNSMSICPVFTDRPPSEPSKVSNLPWSIQSGFMTQGLNKGYLLTYRDVLI